MRPYREHAPGEGGLGAAGAAGVRAALRERRPALVRAELEALVEEVMPHEGRLPRPGRRRVPRDPRLLGPARTAWRRLTAVTRAASVAGRRPPVGPWGAARGARRRAGLWRRPDFARLWGSQTVSCWGRRSRCSPCPWPPSPWGRGRGRWAGSPPPGSCPPCCWGCSRAPGSTACPRRPLLIATDLGRGAVLAGRPARGAHRAPAPGGPLPRRLPGQRPGGARRGGARRLPAGARRARPAGGGQQQPGGGRSRRPRSPGRRSRGRWCRPPPPPSPCSPTRSSFVRLRRAPGDDPHAGAGTARAPSGRRPRALWREIGDGRAVRGGPPGAAAPHGRLGPVLLRLLPVLGPVPAVRHARAGPQPGRVRPDRLAQRRRRRARARWRPARSRRAGRWAARWPGRSSSGRSGRCSCRWPAARPLAAAAVLVLAEAPAPLHRPALLRSTTLSACQALHARPAAGAGERLRAGAARPERCRSAALLGGVARRGPRAAGSRPWWRAWVCWCAFAWLALSPVRSLRALPDEGRRPEESEGTAPAGPPGDGSAPASRGGTKSTPAPAAPVSGAVEPRRAAATSR